MIAVMRKRTISGEQWRKIISQQPASGLSIAAFCRQAEVSPASFYVWRRKLRRDTAHFAEVKITPEPGPESSGIELRLSNGRCVLVRPGFDRQTLLDLLATLEHGGHAASSEKARGGHAASSDKARGGHETTHDGACGAAAAREVGRRSLHTRTPSRRASS
jgi:hypothetical protein